MAQKMPSKTAHKAKKKDPTVVSSLWKNGYNPGIYRRPATGPLGSGTQKETPANGWCFFLEAPPRLELGVKVLQTSALPLGYGAGNRRPTVSWSR